MFMSCPNGNDNGVTNDPHNHTVTITQSAGGTITANPMSGPSGTVVSVFVNPNLGHRYVLGSLRHNNTPILDTGTQPFSFTLTQNAVITATFEPLPDDQFSVTIGTFSNGTITATPSYGPEGTVINLVINPAVGFRLRENSLTFTEEGGSLVPITGTSFVLPAENVTINAVFEPFEATQFSVTIGTFSNGTITATPSSGPEGTVINLAINPAVGFRLRKNSLTSTEEGGSPAPITGTSFTLPAANVTVNAEFEPLPAGQFSVTIGTLSNGTIIASPLFGSEGTVISLTINPASGFVLRENYLTFTAAGGGPVSITGTSFTLPAANVTVNAAFDQGNVNTLITSGINALFDGNFDAAIRAFDDAYRVDNNNQEALLYSSLARLAAIAVDDNVRAFVSDRLGIRNYPGTINALVNLDWMETYTQEELQWGFWSADYNGWAQWRDANDTWFFGQFEDLPPISGYYVTRWWERLEAELISTEWNDEIGYEGDYHGHWVQWRDANDTWFFEDTGLPPISGYYATWGWTWGQEAILVSTERRYHRWTSLLPGLDVPAWFQDTNVFENSLTSAGLKSPVTFSLLMFANLLDRNTHGLNDLLDGLLSSVFGASFDEAARRATAMTGTVRLNQDLLEALGINDLLEGDVVEIGRAELNVLFSLMRIVRGSLEWLAAYDWNTDLNFLANGQLWDDWSLIEDIPLGPASLPLRNNFLRDRNNGMMARSRDSFIQALNDLMWSYDFWIGEASNLPPAYRDILSDFQWVRSGALELREAIITGGRFYLRDSSDSDTYANIPDGAIFGINMGTLFTPGHFSIDRMLSIQDTGGTAAPRFYGWQDYDSQPVPINSLADLRQHRVIGFSLNLQPVQEVVVLGFEFNETSVELQLMPPDIAEIIWGWYHD
ncbi:MAG: hypothetical protein FWB78_02175 [Treponema sp.]|nr:hypothetical protein [Treponema sp.]